MKIKHSIFILLLFGMIFSNSRVAFVRPGALMRLSNLSPYSEESNFSISTNLLKEYEDAIVMASAMLRGTTLLGFNKEGMKYD